MITASHYEEDTILAAEYFREASEVDPKKHGCVLSVCGLA